MCALTLLWKSPLSPSHGESDFVKEQWGQWWVEIQWTNLSWPRTWSFRILLCCPTVLLILCSGMAGNFPSTWFAAQTFLLLQVCSLKLFNADFQTQNAVVFPSFSSGVPCHWKLPLYVLAPCFILVPMTKPLSPASLQECNCHLLGVWQSPGFSLVILL